MNGLPHLAAGGAPAPAYGLQNASLSFKGADLGLHEDLDIGQAGNAVDQIARHARLQAGAAHEKPDLGDLARQVHRRLTRGVAGAHQGHLLPGAQPRLQWRGPVVDARALESREILDIEASVPGATRDNHRAGADAFAVAEIQGESLAPGRRVVLQAHDFVRYGHLGPELLRLVVGARHQRHTGDSGRKA